MGKACTACKADPLKFADKARDAYDANPEKFRKRTREWNLANREKSAAQHRKCARVTRWHVALASQCRRLSIKKGLPACDLDAEYLLALFNEQGGRCHWLGIALVPSVEHRAPRRPSIDRLDNSAGYVRGNVVIASQFANMGRSSLDADTFALFVRDLRREIATKK